MDKDNTEVAGLSSENEGDPEASGESPEHEAEREGEEQQQQEVPVRQRQTENEVSEVEIPNVGRIMVRADADGYNEEVSTIIMGCKISNYFIATLQNCSS